ncbi:hypothetical protein AB6A40_005152 [Gnathostoma spinigerum]|uniref:Uncharacterized protein n=1 Tax=Gnathostoma spinigerum TaxID=75299 RepID=A0ABD6EEM1_9BILA
MSAPSLIRRAMTVLAGGLALTAALAWLISRRRRLAAEKRKTWHEDQSQSDDAKGNLSSVELIKSLPAAARKKHGENQCESEFERKSNGTCLLNSEPPKGESLISEKKQSMVIEDKCQQSANGLKRKRADESESNSLSGSSPLTSEHSEEVITEDEPENDVLFTSEERPCVSQQEAGHLSLAEKEEPSFNWSNEVETELHKKSNTEEVSRKEDAEENHNQMTKQDKSIMNEYPCAASPSGRSEWYCSPKGDLAVHSLKSAVSDIVINERIYCRVQQ